MRFVAQLKIHFTALLLLFHNFQRATVWRQERDATEFSKNKIRKIKLCVRHLLKTRTKVKKKEREVKKRLKEWLSIGGWCMDVHPSEKEEERKRERKTCFFRNKKKSAAWRRKERPIDEECVCVCACVCTAALKMYLSKLLRSALFCHSVLTCSQNARPSLLFMKINRKQSRDPTVCEHTTAATAQIKILQLVVLLWGLRAISQFLWDRAAWKINGLRSRWTDL